MVIMLIIVAADARRYMNKYGEEDFLHLLDAIQTFDERSDTQETTNGKCINGKGESFLYFRVVWSTFWLIILIFL